MSTTHADPLSTPLTPSHITLLLKHHKSTVLLSVLPSTHISALKILLLAALTSRGITTLTSNASSSKATSISLPTDPDDIQFGVLVDKKDASKGFKLLAEDQQEGTKSSSSNKKGKGRATKPSSTSAGGDTVDAAGLTDGGWVAYRVRNEAAAVEDEEDDDGDVVVDINDLGWDVVVASFEEAEAAMQGEEGMDREEEEDEDEDEEEGDIPIPDVARVR